MKKIMTAFLATAIALSALAATKVTVESFKTGSEIFVVDEVGNIISGVVGESIFINESDAQAYAATLESLAENIE